MQAATITKAIVKRASGAPVRSKFNDEMRIAISVEKQDGTTETIWGNEKSVIRLYRQGDTIEYTKAGNEYVFFNEPKAQHVSDNVTHAAQTAQMSDAAKFKKMAEWANVNARYYAHLFKNVQDNMQDYSLKDENLVSITTSLYIQSSRVFS